MSGLYKLTYYLGIEFKQEKTRITLKQEAYAQRILIQVRLQECNPTQFLMETGTKVYRAEDEPKINPTQYHKIVACL